VSVLCSTSLSPVDDLGSLSIDQIAQLGLSSLQVIYYSEQLFRAYWRLKYKRTEVSITLMKARFSCKRSE
ncbi:hypothetical protein, partial [Symbiopectobacterium sp.]|uniref:hypothetical protein n=1 Tax=Symbiopectobacterium sp. TaxID=2952789 RepID=UPI003F39E5F1